MRGLTRIRAIAVLTGLAAFVAGAGVVPRTLAAVTSPEPPLELRAYVNDRCIVADEPFYQPENGGGTSERSLALVGFIASKLAGLFLEQAVGAAATRLQSRAARRDTRYAVATQTSLYVAQMRPSPVVRLNAHLGCLTIVAGQFEPGDGECRARYQPRTLATEMAQLPAAQWRTDRADDSLENPLRRASVCAVRVRAVYEARFEFSPDGTAWRLRNAGYRIDRLLTTDREGVERSVFYTLDVRAPGRTKDPELLATAWIDLGRIAAGARDAGAAAPEVPWLRVPPLSDSARRFYDESTQVQQDTAAHIDALQRALARNERVLTTLEQRRRGAAGALAASLRAEVVRTQTQGITLQAELEARRSEYAALPQEPLDLMSVSVEVGVTETASERKALRALAMIVDGSRGFIASTALNAASGLVVRRSIDAPPDDAPRREFEAARAAYYDALVDLQAGTADAPKDDASLRDARERFDAAKRAITPDAAPQTPTPREPSP